MYPEVTLATAHEKREKARDLLEDNIDPSQAKKEADLEKQLSTENSFEAITREWHEHQKGGWTERHANYVLRRLEADLFPTLGFKAINEIKAPELLLVLRTIETRI